MIIKHQHNSNAVRVAGRCNLSLEKARVAAWSVRPRRCALGVMFSTVEGVVGLFGLFIIVTLLLQKAVYVVLSLGFLAGVAPTLRPGI